MVDEEALPEYVVRLDTLHGEHRNANLIVIGSVGSKRILIGIEAKADESFGEEIGEYYDRQKANGRSMAPNRIESLAMLHSCSSSSARV